MLATRATLGKEEFWNHDTLQRLITWKIKADLSESCPHLLQKPAEGHQADKTLEMQFYTDISGSIPSLKVTVIATWEKVEEGDLSQMSSDSLPVKQFA